MFGSRAPGWSVRLGSLGGLERWLTAEPVGFDEPRLDPDEAISRVRAAVGRFELDLGQVHALLARASFVAPLARSGVEQWAAIESALRAGTLAVVEGRREPIRGGPRMPVVASDEPEPLDAPAPILDAPVVGAGLRVLVIERGGRAVSGLPVLLADNSGQRPTAGAGMAVFEPIAAGRHGLRLGDPEALASIDWDTRPERGLDSPLPDEDHVYVELDLDGRGETQFEAATTDARTLVVIDRPVLRVIVPDQARCDHDSAILVPGPWTGGAHPLAALVHGLVALTEQPYANPHAKHDRWLVVAGHASASGSAALNDALSEARADAVRAVVEGDVDAWVGHARDRGSLRDVIAYLDYLGRERGWSCTPELDPAAHDRKSSPETKAAVSAFQSDYNTRFEGALAVDGVCGPKTLAAVFDVLRDELIRWLDKLGATLEGLPLDRVVYLGHGATLAGTRPPVLGGDDPEVADRVVDFVLVERAAFDPGIEATSIYASPVAWRLERKLPHEPDAWATGPLTLVSDLRPDEPAEAETYVIESEDGSWAEERVLPDQGEVEAGELVLRFPALPTEHRYTLTVIAASGNQSVVFDKLRYNQFHRAGGHVDDGG